MNDGIWVSAAPASTETVVGLEADILQENNAFALDCIRRNIAGEPLSPGCFPKRINIDPSTDQPDDPANTLHLFHGGYWHVSNTCAAALLSADLGNGAVYPVDFLKQDRTTPLPGKY